MFFFQCGRRQQSLAKGATKGVFTIDEMRAALNFNFKNIELMNA